MGVLRKHETFSATGAPRGDRSQSNGASVGRLKKHHRTGSRLPRFSFRHTNPPMQTCRWQRRLQSSGQVNITTRSSPRFTLSFRVPRRARRALCLHVSPTRTGCGPRESGSDSHRTGERCTRPAESGAMGMERHETSRRKLPWSNLNSHGRGLSLNVSEPLDLDRSRLIIGPSGN